MNICHLINSYPLPSGGMQTYCYDLADVQSRHGHDVKVYVSGIISSSAVNKRFHIKSFKPVFNFGKATVSPTLVSALLKEKCDIFHIHLPFPFGFETALAIAKLRKIPLVVTYHCEVYDYQNSIMKGFIMNIYNVINRFLIRYVNWVIFTTEDYSKLFNFSKSKTSIIPIGVDTRRFRALNRINSRKYLKLPEKKFIVIFVGNLDVHNYYKKGVEYLLNAVPLIKKNIPNIFIDLVGKTDAVSLDMINHICRKKNISDIVRVSGYASEKELPQHYSASNVLVLPSVSKLEAFGIVLLEAMASGIPVIASDIPGVRSVVNITKNGYLIKPYSSTSIAKIVVKVRNFRKIQVSDSNKIKNIYSWQNIGQQILTIYQKVLTT